MSTAFKEEVFNIQKVLDSQEPVYVKAPVGDKLHCKGWIQEAAFRMLLNNLDPNVAENPLNLVVYGGSGKAARSWSAFKAILKALMSLENDETLLVQSGKPVGVFKSTAQSPRVLIANSNLVGNWANWDYFRELEKKGLIMYGQMTAGSWIYIGTQGILQGTYETFSALAQKHFGGSLNKKIVLTAGLGGMGGAQPLAVTMNGGIALCIEAELARIQKRLDTGYLDVMAQNLDEAIDMCLKAQSEDKSISIGLNANAAEVLPQLLNNKKIKIDIVTDQTSAHDPLTGYIPVGYSFEEALNLRKSDPEKYIELSKKSITTHVKAMLDFKKNGSIVFDYGNNIRQIAYDCGVKDAFDFPGFVPAYIRPLFCEGKGPFRFAALSGDTEDIRKIDEAIIQNFSNNPSLVRWIKLASERIHFQGLPARICWLGYGDRAKLGKIINEMVAQKKLKAPIVIGRDHLDCGSVASPNRETESMKDGSDAISDWVYLNALINAVNGASWVSIHHGGGVGIGYSQHAGCVIVADGTKEAENRIERVLTSDPGMGVIRHVDSGYEEAIEFAKNNKVRIPMWE